MLRRVVLWTILLGAMLYGAGLIVGPLSLEWQLWQASHAGNVPRIIQLRKAGAKVDKAKFFGYTALGAASNGYMGRLGVGFLSGLHPELMIIEKALTQECTEGDCPLPDEQHLFGRIQ